MAHRDSDEVKQTLKRIEGHPNVTGVIMVDKGGQIVHSTLQTQEAICYIQHCRVLTTMARRAIKEMDPTDDLQFFRIRTKKSEIMLAPENDYLLLVVQNASKTAGKSL